MTSETMQTSEKPRAKDNGQTKSTTGSAPGGQKPRIIRNPGDVAGLVMMQVDNVNAKKDELTIAIKGLTDTAKQLVRAYAEHAKAIQKLQQRIKMLEEKADTKA